MFNARNGTYVDNKEYRSLYSSIIENKTLKYSQHCGKEHLFLHILLMLTATEYNFNKLANEQIVIARLLPFPPLYCMYA